VNITRATCEPDLNGCGLLSETVGRPYVILRLMSKVFSLRWVYEHVTTNSKENTLSIVLKSAGNGNWNFWPKCSSHGVRMTHTQTGDDGFTEQLLAEMRPTGAPSRIRQDGCTVTLRSSLKHKKNSGTSTKKGPSKFHTITWPILHTGLSDNWLPLS